jgi:hypothetical protein
MTYKEKIEQAIEKGNADTLKIIFDTFDTNMVMAMDDPNKIAKAKVEYAKSIKSTERIYNAAIDVLNQL